MVSWMVGKGEQLARRDVAQDQVAGGKIAEAVDVRGGGDAPAHMGEISGKRVGDGLGAAARNGPSDRMGYRSEYEAEGGAEGLIESQEGVGCETAEKRSCGFGAEMAAGDVAGGEHRGEAEAGEEEWVLGEMKHGAEDVGGEIRPAADEGLHQAAPGRAVLAQVSLRRGKVALQRDRGAVEQQLMLVSRNLVEPQLADVIERRAEPDAAGDIRRPGF